MILSELFGCVKPVIGMLHLPPLPGSPAHSIAVSGIRDWVLRDASALSAGGVDGLILENYGDAPFFPRRVPPHTVAFMTAIGAEVRSRFALPLGINVLRNDGLAAIAVAAAVEAAFVRVNVFTGARLTDQGIIEGQAHKLQRYRRLLAREVRIFADVAVKHSAPIAVRPLADEVEDTIWRGGADAIIVSGRATGQETPIQELRVAKAAAGEAAVLAGSGTTLANAIDVLAVADGLIVGTALKSDGAPANPVDPSRVRELAEVTETAVAEARAYRAAGFHGLIVENTHDRPYLKGAPGPEIAAAMAVAGFEVRRAVDLPLGIQVLAGANQASIAVAHACGAAFVRVEGFVFAHVADEGIIEASAGELLRYRRNIGAERIRVFADVKKKHSAHAITADLDIVETSKAAEFFQADGVIISGPATGRPADPGELRAVAEAISIPALVGSGITPENLADYAAADALVIGSSLKSGGLWFNPLDHDRLDQVARAFQDLVTRRH